MTNTEHSEDLDPIQTRTRRSWSRERKLELLEEAACSSIWATAKKYAINPALLYTWRREFGDSSNETRSCDPEGLLEEHIESVGRMSQLLTSVTEAIASDIKCKRGNPCNQANALSSLVNAGVKLRELELEILDRVQLQSHTENKPELSETDIQIRQESERLLREFVLRRILPKQEEAKRQAQAERVA